MLALALATLAAIPPPLYPEDHYAIEAAVPEDLSAIEGKVIIDAVNDSGSRIDALTLWLYPQIFSRQLSGITGITEPFYQPWGDGLGGMTIGDLLVAGTPAIAEPLPLPDVPPDAAFRIALPRSLAPGERAVVSMRFSVRVPHRVGPFGRAKGVLTAMGGFYPYVTARDPRSQDERERLPSQASFDVVLKVPQGYWALAGGLRPDAGGAVHVDRRAYLDLFVRPEAIAPLPARGNLVFPLEPPPGGGGGETGGLPDPAELSSAWNGDDIQRAIRHISSWADARLPPAQGPIDAVVVPLRSEVALFTPGVVAVSDRAYALPPWPDALRYHDRALARAWLGRRVLPLVQRLERPADVITTADAVGAFLAQQFMAEQTETPADLKSLLSDLDFVPGVDEFLRSPKSAFPQVYLQPVAEPIPVRDEPWTFSNVASRGRLLEEKLLDWLGTPSMQRAIDAYLRNTEGCVEPAPGPGEAPCSLQHAVEVVTGRDMSVFFRAWTGKVPSEDLRAEIAGTTRLDHGYQDRVIVYRVGDTPPEVIEVAATDRDGRRYLLVWRAEAGESQKAFDVRTGADITSLIVDPRGRVFQSAQEPGQSPVKGDFVPERLQLLLNFISVAYHLPDHYLSGATSLILRRRDELSRRLYVNFSFDAAHIGGGADAVVGFGPLLDAARYTNNITFGFAGEYLRNGFGGGNDGFAVGPRAFYAYDSRPPIPEPRAGTAFAVGLGAQLTGSSSTPVTVIPAAGATLVRLWPLGSRLALGSRLKFEAVGSGAPVQDLIPLGGTDQGLRGFSLSEVLSEREGVLSLSWRHVLLPDLDVDLGVVRLRGVHGALFADAALAANVLRQGPQGSFVDNQIHPFADVGYGLDFLYDFLGVRPLVLGVDVGIPFGRLPENSNLPGFTLTVRASQAFTAL